MALKSISYVDSRDFSQLPPVQYKSLYDTKQTTGFPAKGKMRYKLFDKCVEFDEIMRQVIVHNSRVEFVCFLSIPI